MEENKNKSLAVPIAIVVAGLLVAGTLLYTNISSDKKGAAGNNQNDKFASVVVNVRPVDATDHLIGDPNAPVKIIEYSDLECPFCKSFHATMQAIMQSELGRNGKAAWVYRNFPLAQLHSKAVDEAEAAECAGKIGGNLKFWEFINKIFEITPSNNNLDLSELSKTAMAIGLDSSQFQSCLDSNEMLDRVNNDLADAIKGGGAGTPWTVVTTQSGKTFVINGAEPYAVALKIVQTAVDSQ